MCVCQASRQLPKRDTCAGRTGQKADVSSGVWQTAPELMFLEFSFLPFSGSPQVHWLSRWYCLTSSNLIYFYSCLLECCISTHARLIEPECAGCVPYRGNMAQLLHPERAVSPPLSILTSRTDTYIFMAIQVNSILAGWPSHEAGPSPGLREGDHFYSASRQHFSPLPNLLGCHV